MLEQIIRVLFSVQVKPHYSIIYHKRYYLYYNSAWSYHRRRAPWWSQSWLVPLWEKSRAMRAKTCDFIYSCTFL